MSFNAIQRTTEEPQEQEGPTEAEALSGPALVEAIAPAAAERTAATPAAAPDSFDDELATVAVGRDIRSEAVAPPTRTEAEAEKAAAAEPAGGDPALAGAAPAGAETASAPTETAPAAETKPDEDEDKSFRLDEEELRGYGLHEEVIAAIAGMTPKDARDVVEEIRAKHADIENLNKRKGEIQEQAKKDAAAQRQAGGRGGLFSSIAQMFAPRTPESREINRANKEIGEAQDYLSNESVRDRVQRMRREEIVKAADGLSGDARRMSVASQSFNDAVRATPAGQAIETEIASIMERHPDLSRNDIIASAKAGTLAGKIGEDTLTPHVRAAFEDAGVRAAWDRVSAVGDTIEKRGSTLAARLDAYEEDFPGATDAEKLRENLDNAMKGLEKTLEEPIAEDPQAKRRLAEILAELGKKIAEFFQKMLAKFGFGPKP